MTTPSLSVMLCAGSDSEEPPFFARDDRPAEFDEAMYNGEDQVYAPSEEDEPSFLELLYCGSAATVAEDPCETYDQYMSRASRKPIRKVLPAPAFHLGDVDEPTGDDEPAALWAAALDGGETDDEPLSPLSDSDKANIAAANQELLFGKERLSDDASIASPLASSKDVVPPAFFLPEGLKSN